MDSNQELVGDENVSKPLPSNKFIQGLKFLFPISALIGAVLGGLFGWLVLGWGLAAVLAVIGGAIGFFAQKADEASRVPLVLALVNITFALIIMPVLLFFVVPTYNGINAAPKYDVSLFQFLYCGSVPVLTGLSFVSTLANKNQMSRYMYVVISQANFLSILVYLLIALITMAM